MTLERRLPCRSKARHIQTLDIDPELIDVRTVSRVMQAVEQKPLL